MLKTQLGGQAGGGVRDFVLVDLRRVDHEVRRNPPPCVLPPLALAGRCCCHFAVDIYQQGGTIRGSINLPAQSLYPTLPTLYSVLKAASVRKVIWYCCE